MEFLLRHAYFAPGLIIRYAYLKYLLGYRQYTVLVLGLAPQNHLLGEWRCSYYCIQKERYKPSMGGARKVAFGAFFSVAPGFVVCVPDVRPPLHVGHSSRKLPVDSRGGRISDHQRLD